MQQPSPKPATIGAIRCRLVGHRFRITQKVTNFVNEYECTCCKQEYSENSNGRLEVLTQKTREINESLSDLFIRRRRHRVTQYSH
ncbi:MAG: hypothetical protein ABJM06_12065 [Gilvibacter sp.]